MRVKRGTASRKRHKKVLNRAEGFKGRRSTAFKVAKLAVQKAEQHATKDRKIKKREFRKLWIARINAACRIHGLSYSRFMHGLKIANISVDRKILSELAYSSPESFARLADQVKSAA